MRDMREEAGKRDLLVADAEELQEHHAPEVSVTRVNTKEVVVVKEGDPLIFPCAIGMIKSAGKGSEARTSNQILQGPQKTWIQTAVIIQMKRTTNLTLQNNNKMRWNDIMSKNEK